MCYSHVQKDKAEAFCTKKTKVTNRPRKGKSEKNIQVTLAIRREYVLVSLANGEICE